MDYNSLKEVPEELQAEYVRAILKNI